MPRRGALMVWEKLLLAIWGAMPMILLRVLMRLVWLVMSPQMMVRLMRVKKFSSPKVSMSLMNLMMVKCLPPMRMTHSALPRPWEMLVLRLAQSPRHPVSDPRQRRTRSRHPVPRQRRRFPPRQEQRSNQAPRPKQRPLPSAKPRQRHTPKPVPGPRVNHAPRSPEREKERTKKNLNSGRTRSGRRCTRFLGICFLHLDSRNWLLVWYMLVISVDRVAWI